MVVAIRSSGPNFQGVRTMPRLQADIKTVNRSSNVYRIWKGIRDRCNNPRSKDFANYGGRGIRVCERWDSFSCFRDDMGPRPDGGTIERRENSGNYEPSNCVWATMHAQRRNKRTNVLIEFNGRSMCVTDWAIETGIPKTLIRHRMKAGWSIERILTVDPKQYRKRGTSNQ